MNIKHNSSLLPSSPAWEQAVLQFGLNGCAATTALLQFFSTCHSLIIAVTLIRTEHSAALAGQAGRSLVTGVPQSLTQPLKRSTELTELIHPQHGAVAEPNSHFRKKTLPNNSVIGFVLASDNENKQTPNYVTLLNLCPNVNTALGDPCASVTLKSPRTGCEQLTSNKVPASTEKRLETSTHVSQYDQSR